MASKLENWWSVTHPFYSLKHLVEMPAYLKFKSFDSYFQKFTDSQEEAFWKIDNCEIYEWFDNATQTGEKLGFDHNSETWFYEHWFIKDSIHTLTKTWINQSKEWGVIITKQPDCENYISWTLGKCTKIYEESTKTGELLIGTKQGICCTSSGLEDFCENFWEKPGEKGREKNWVRGTARGAEKEFTQGDTQWGEYWSEDQEMSEKKEWRKVGDKDTVKKEGNNGKMYWIEKWVKDANFEIEDNLWVEDGKKWGLMRDKRPDQAYKLEWEGLRPEIGSSADGIAKIELTVKLLDIYRKQKGFAILSDQLLTLFVLNYPGLQEEASKLSNVLKNWVDPDFDDPNSIISKLADLTSLEIQQEEFKKKVLLLISPKRYIPVTPIHILDGNDGISSSLPSPIDRSSHTFPIICESNMLKKDNESLNPLNGEAIEGPIIGSIEMQKEFSELLSLLKNSTKILNKIESNSNLQEDVTIQNLTSQQNGLNEISQENSANQKYEILLSQIINLLNDHKELKEELVGKETNENKKDLIKSDPLIKQEPLKATEKFDSSKDEKEILPVTGKLESSKDEKELLPISSASLLRLVLINGKEAQNVIAEILRNLGNDEYSEELIEKGNNAITRIITESESESLLSLKYTLEELFPVMISECELIRDLAEKPKINKPAAKGIQRAPKAAKVRSQKPGQSSNSSIDITSHAIDILNDSYETLTNISSLISGNKPNVIEKIENFDKFKNEIAGQFTQSGTNGRTVEDLFSLLKDFEKEKREFLNDSETLKNQFISESDNLIQKSTLQNRTVKKTRSTNIKAIETQENATPQNIEVKEGENLIQKVEIQAEETSQKAIREERKSAVEPVLKLNPKVTENATSQNKTIKEAENLIQKVDTQAEEIAQKTSREEIKSNVEPVMKLIPKVTIKEAINEDGEVVTTTTTRRIIKKTVTRKAH